MTFELWNSLATTGTFLVIAATAIAALVQLRHARNGNQISAMDSLREETMQPGFADAQQFVLTGLPKMLQDPAFRHQLIHREARTSENQKIITKVFMVGNFYAYIGQLVKRRLINPDIALDLWGTSIGVTWRCLLPVTAIVRRDNPLTWESFEYVAVLSDDFAKAHRDVYPRGVRRFDVKDDWLEADVEHALA